MFDYSFYAMTNICAIKIACIHCWLKIFILHNEFYTLTVSKKTQVLYIFFSSKMYHIW